MSFFVGTRPRCPEARNMAPPYRLTEQCYPRQPEAIARDAAVQVIDHLPCEAWHMPGPRTKTLAQR